MPAPLMEFGKFAHPHRWWLRRGEPPWLDDSRWNVRAFRVTLVLGLIGAASGWLTTGGLLLASFLDEVAGGQLPWLTEGGLGILCGPGFYFAVITLIPLSRWLRRGWIMSLLAIPASMIASYAGVITLLFVDPVTGSGPGWIPGGEQTAGFYAGFVGAAIVSIWMGHPLRREAWLAGMSASVLAGLACVFYFLAQPDSTSSMVPGRLGELLRVGVLYVGFQSLTAVGLGVRLWWRRSRMKEGEKEGMRD